jgi:hypothetical protein
MELKIFSKEKEKKVYFFFFFFLLLMVCVIGGVIQYEENVWEERKRMILLPDYASLRTRQAGAEEDGASAAPSTVYADKEEKEREKNRNLSVFASLFYSSNSPLDNKPNTSNKNN